MGFQPGSSARQSSIEEDAVLIGESLAAVRPVAL
jgi:hypothetical protein